MRKKIRRLRLREGDFIVVKDHQTLEAVLAAGRGIKNIPNCPVILAPNGIFRLGRAYLKRLMEKTA